MRTRLFSLLPPLALIACARPAGQPNTDGSSPVSAIAFEQSVYLRAHTTGLYLSAELGGGGDVHANRPFAGPWEQFVIRSTGGPDLESGAQVVFETSAGGHFLSADNGGGAGVSARAASAGPNETFQLDRLDGPGLVSSSDRISIRAASGQYVVAEEGGGGVVNANRAAVGPWETWELRTDPASGADDVLDDDGHLVAPRTSGPVIGAILGYEMNSPCPFADPAMCDLPMYSRYDRDDPDWWTFTLDELLHARLPVIFAHGRGCFDPTSGLSGNGNMCPRLLSRLVAAIDRAGARDAVRLAMFDDTGAYPGTRNIVEGRPFDEPFDLSDRTSWRFFWDHNMEVWFDTVPRDLWFRIDGRPLVAFWSLADAFFSHQSGNASALLRDLRARFNDRYGEDPLFIVDGTWIEKDPSLTTNDVFGVNDWFGPPANNFTYRSWNGSTFGAAVPGFRDPNNHPGCGNACREVPRRDGAALSSALDAGASARVILLEGWTDVAESAGSYRSNVWRYPNLPIRIVREHAESSFTTLRFEAEAADAYVDTTSGNSGGAYRDGDLDIGHIDDGGFFVGWTAPGESLTFRDVRFSCGAYRFTARIRSTSGARMHVDLGDGSPPPTDVPAGDASFRLINLGVSAIEDGTRDVSLVFDTSGADVDWFFARRLPGPCHP
jgi:hypothetical protein